MSCREACMIDFRNSAPADWIRRRLPPCRIIVQWISELQDAKGSPKRSLIVRLHLLICRRCSLFKAQVSIVSLAVRTYSETDHAPLSAESKSRLRLALTQQ